MGFQELLEKYRVKNKLKKINKKKYNIFVCYHKPFDILENEVLTPIHAGRAVAANPLQDTKITPADLKWLKSKMISDDSGENISEKNRYYNECSVTYWMWKNISSPYVGLFHYRRVFNMNSDKQVNMKEHSVPDIYGITYKNLEKLMSEYDLLLPFPMGFTTSIYESYVKYLVKDDIDFAFDYIRFKYPEMHSYAEKLKVSHVAYLFNMFVTSREIFEGYAKFLFDVLFALEHHIKDRERRSIYWQRAEGFLAERLTSIYFDYLIETKNLKVKECQVIRLDEVKRKKLFSFKSFAVKNDKNKGVTLVLRIKL